MALCLPPTRNHKLNIALRFIPTIPPPLPSQPGICARHTGHLHYRAQNVSVDDNVSFNFVLNLKVCGVGNGRSRFIKWHRREDKKEAKQGSRGRTSSRQTPTRPKATKIQLK